LIDEKGTALLSDFGLSTVIAEFQGTSYLTSNIRGAVRYAAPEIYKLSDTAMYSTANSGSSDTAIPSSGNMSNSSDVYSFGCVMLQVGIDQISGVCTLTPLNFLSICRHFLAEYPIITCETMPRCYWKFTVANPINDHTSLGSQTAIGSSSSDAGIEPLNSGLRRVKWLSILISTFIWIRLREG
jgi:serine/threonine protein kinase